MRHILFVVADHILTISITVALVFAVLAASGTWKREVGVVVPLDVRTPIVVRYETVDGEEIRPPETMPLWQYVQSADYTNRFMLADFKAAFESDLHAHDNTWQMTHELIDGHKF